MACGENNFSTYKSFVVLAENFDNSSENEKNIISSKVLSNLFLYGIRVLEDNRVVTVIEKILFSFPNPSVVFPIFRIINSDLNFIVTNKYGSKLLEKVLYSCQFDEVGNDENIKDEAKIFNEYMWFHYPEYIENEITSHVVRTWLQFMSGCYFNIENKIYSLNNIITGVPMDDNHIDKLKSLCSRFLFQKKVCEIINGNFMSAFCQLLLFLHQKLNSDDDSIKILMKKFCNIEKKKRNSESSFEIPEYFKDQHKSFFIESLLSVYPDGKVFKKFVQVYLRDELSKFVLAAIQNPYCCAIFKCVLNRLDSSQIFQSTVEIMHKQLLNATDTEIGNVFMDLLIILVNKISIFTLAEKQLLRIYKHNLTEIIQHLSKSKTCDKPSLSIFLLNGLKEDSEEAAAMKDVCGKQASKLMQCILTQFNPLPKSINKMFTEQLDRLELLRMCRDSKANRVIELYISSTTVPSDSKYNMIQKLTEQSLCQMAMHKYGSRVIDKIFDWCKENTKDDKARASFMLLRDNLEPFRDQLRANKIGKYAYFKIFGYSSEKIMQSFEKTDQKNNLTIKHDKNNKEKNETKKRKIESEKIMQSFEQKTDQKNNLTINKLDKINKEKNENKKRKIESEKVKSKKQKT